MDPASLLKDVILLGGFICPEKILVIVELLELPIVGVFLLAGDRFYSYDFVKFLPFPVTVLGRFSFYTFTIVIYFFVSYLLKSLGILRLDRLSTTIVFDLESFRPSSFSVLFFLKISASLCLIFSSSTKNMLFRLTIFSIWQKSISESDIFLLISFASSAMS